jgi:Putative restriction endonuclease
MITSPPQDYISPEEYLEAEKLSQVKHEYIDGEIYAMAGASDTHITVSMNIGMLLRNHLRGTGCRTYPPYRDLTKAVVQRLLAQKCEICGATDNIEVHHIRKLADIKRQGCKERPEWMKKMSARRRKTLVVCRQCHEKIQYGRYDGKTFKT